MVVLCDIRKNLTLSSLVRIRNIHGLNSRFHLPSRCSPIRLHNGQTHRRCPDHRRHLFLLHLTHRQRDHGFAFRAWAQPKTVFVNGLGYEARTQVEPALDSLCTLECISDSVEHLFTHTMVSSEY